MRTRVIKEAAAAIRAQALDSVNVHGAHNVAGEIVSLNPLSVDVPRVGIINEADGELILGDTVKTRDDLLPLSVGDTLALVLLGDDWVAVDVISDQTVPAPGVGESGNDAYYVFVQLAPANPWTINHPLAKKASITTLDQDGVKVEGDVTYVSDSQIVVAWSGAMSGTAVLN